MTFETPSSYDKVCSFSIYSFSAKMFGKGRVALLLPELLKDWPCTVDGGEFRVAVKGITENSADVKNGFIFVARKGKNNDGASHIAEALRCGAVAIVIDRSTMSDIPMGIPIVTVPDCRLFLSHASARFSGNPSERLTVIAVTGTNGKTTVTHFIGQLLNGLGMRTAVIGTTGIFIDGTKINYMAPQMTTLPAEYLHPLLKKCEDEGVSHIVLEASSLGLSTFRLDHCKIDVGLLLNIGTDHYDEHGGKLQYIEAKKRLLKMAKQVVVNMDDDLCIQMSKASPIPCVFFGTKAGSDVHLSNQGGKLNLSTRHEEGELSLSVPGEFNYMNVAAAISALLVLGFQLEEILPHTLFLKLPEGRMQHLQLDGITVFVDFAHTPDALEVVLRSLSANCSGKLITVFGCGGDRDKGKRKKMGELAALYSSSVIVTSDNPRSEDPLSIIADIMEGFGDGCAAIEAEPDRELAIQKAISRAYSGDIVLIAGKGHEKTQQTAEGIFPFSDHEQAERALFGRKKEII